MLISEATVECRRGPGCPSVQYGHWSNKDTGLTATLRICLLDVRRDIYFAKKASKRTCTARVRGVNSITFVAFDRPQGVGDI